MAYERGEGQRRREGRGQKEGRKTGFCSSVSSVHFMLICQWLRDHIEDPPLSILSTDSECFILPVNK